MLPVAIRHCCLLLHSLSFTLQGHGTSGMTTQWSLPLLLLCACPPNLHWMWPQPSRSELEVGRLGGRGSCFHSDLVGFNFLHYSLTQWPQSGANMHTITFFKCSWCFCDTNGGEVLFSSHLKAHLPKSHFAKWRTNQNTVILRNLPFSEFCSAM